MQLWLRRNWVIFIHCYFNECTRIIDSPSYFVLDSWITLSKMKVPLKVHFMNPFELFPILSISMRICFVKFYQSLLILLKLRLKLNLTLMTDANPYHVNSDIIYLQWNYLSLENINKLLIRQWKFKRKTKMETVSLRSLFTTLIIW